MRSLAQQLHMGLAIGLLLLLGVLGWGGVKITSSLSEHFVASRLVHDAEAVLSALRLDDSGRPPVRWRRLASIYQQPFSGHYYQIVFADGETLRSRSLWDQELAIPHFSPGSEAQWRLPGPDAQELLVRVAGYQKQGRTFTLAVAEDMTPLNQRISRFQWMLLGVTLLLVLLLFLGQQWLVRRALRPLARVTEDMRRLEQGEVVRLTTAVPQEVVPLVEQFNRLLGLFQQRLERSRQGLGNLSHALKGPLNLLQQQLQDNALADHAELRQAMGEQVDRLRQLVERELKRARFAGTGMSGNLFNPEQELPALKQVLQSTYRHKALRIEARYVEGVTLPVEREDMLELLGNLLDNACKWARTRVDCTLQLKDGVSLRVEDDGPGVSDDLLDRLTQRGVRIDESVDGHGLGLAICKELVKGYGGEIEFSRSTEFGGLSVTVRLPSNA